MENKVAVLAQKIDFLMCDAVAILTTVQSRYPVGHLCDILVF